jgi:protein-S-isoprenylcysteine O-methyltransferase Ste14
MRRWILPVLILPVNAVIVIPTAAVLVLGFARWPAGPTAAAVARYVVAGLLAAAGVALGAWTASLFARFGKGTAAPWDPPRRLVVRGPYRHVRNPMITGVILILAAEALVFCSWTLAAWCGAFALANALYMPLVEEKRLVRRFGEAYERYHANVPRWLPRLKPWGDAGA